MKDWLGWTVGLAAVILVGMGVAAQGHAETSRSDLIQSLNQSTGKLTKGDKRFCTFSKVGPNQFLTAAHCVDDLSFNRTQLVYQKPGDTDYFANKEKVDGIYLPVSEDATGGPQDWAILFTKKDIEDMVPLVLDCHYKPQVGDDIASMGYPAPLGRTYGEGFISSVSKTDYHGQVHGDFWTTMSANGGASGSPVLHAKTGKLIGVLVEKTRGWDASSVQFIKDTRLCDMVAPYLPTGQVRSATPEPGLEPRPEKWTPEADGYSPF